MTFVEMRDRLIEHFEEMTENINHLFVMQGDNEERWETSLNSFPNVEPAIPNTYFLLHTV